MEDNINIQDLQSDMNMLKLDYEYFIELAYTDYSYDFRMERMEQAIEILSDIICINQFIIKKKHCES